MLTPIVPDFENKNRNQQFSDFSQRKHVFNPECKQTKTDIFSVLQSIALKK